MNQNKDATGKNFVKRGFLKYSKYAALLMLPVLLGYMLFATYGEVKKKTIEEFNKLQMVLAKQAADGIKEFFVHYKSDLLTLSNDDSVVFLDDRGKALMNTYYGCNDKNISAVTRIDASGKIIHTVPYHKESVGLDISRQKHVAQIINTHEPVVSEVFEAIQGYKTIAFHVPVIKNGIFYGSLAILIPFENLATRYIGNLKIGDNGYAWVINEKGTELYCPIPGHTGQSIFETSGQFPSVTAMAREMMKGTSGVSTYQYNRIRGKTIDVFIKHAAFNPIDLGNTFWSVAVATPEKDVLATMNGFKDRFFFIGALLLVVGTVYSWYFVKTRAVLAEEAKRRSAETALRKSIQQYRDVVENANSIILRWDADGTITYLNPFGLDFFGYTEIEIIGKNVIGTIVPATESSSRRDLVSMIAEISKNPDQYKNNVNENVTKNGERVWISWTNKAICDENWHVTKILSIGNDITEKRNLETQLMHAKRMEAIGTLAGGIAHDFNNLLMGIQGRVSLMRLDEGESRNWDEHVKGIEQCVKSAAGLTRQLLGFARGGKYEVKATDLNILVKKNLEMFGRTRKEIILHESYKTDLWLVEVDRGQIEQVLMNIVINGCQAMPGGGDMFIETDNALIDSAFAVNHGVSPGKYVKVAIRDKGVGMDPSVQENIFDPFFTTKEKNRGTGLGLASAYGIIKNHKGFIDFSSEKGKGSVFNIYLPVSDKTAVIKSEKKDILETGSETILLVDDEDITLDVGRKMLEKLGYHILTAKGGGMALDTLINSNGEISLVILDMIMPDMDGGEVFDQIRQINPAAKVLLSSGYSEDGKAAEIIKRGCNGFIQKPFGMAALSQKVREIIDSD